MYYGLLLVIIGHLTIANLGVLKFAVKGPAHSKVT